MKIVTVLGTRPEIIRLSRIIPKLDQLCDHVLIHTGQNNVECLNDIFFKELEIRAPNHYLEAKGTTGEQIGTMFPEVEKILEKEKPDRVLILGDTNSALVAIIAERMGIPTYHMEAGNRCFNKKVPEEINRKLIDSISSFNLPYTNLSKENLLQDGVSKNKIFVVGNPINEVLLFYNDEIGRSKVLKSLNLNSKQYFLATFHRAENVDNPLVLKQMIGSLSLIASEYKMKVICSVHPRTLDRIKKYSVNVEDSNIVFSKPFGFFDFAKLEQEALCVISDSGTVCEETCLLNTPNVITRDSTERPEVIECGSSILAGTNCSKIVNGVRTMLNSPLDWEVPNEYLSWNVSDKVIKILLGEHK